ncbi:acyltransferase [Arthrobacter sp. OV608]|uniref:acyltransferase family protein n=1 Tax=Arthrobacter sp. OV608 TaxID=1882768 RepID=UPI0008BBAEBE|nr:acyltransferase [Arthrobacter sp. OV608]SEP70332.1 Peptidoglycan/LPS O-acetylase OafA/YrhL, contains acyltransferase and SGNH-hydrolase domains [Arthrobacter sp. OV608]
MLGQRFAESKNSLNAVRLLLAAAVILSHSWWLGGYGPEPQPGGVKLGSWAVLGFFGISGFLITRSRTGAITAGSYWRARFLRIFPGLAVCVASVAFVIAPVTAGVAGKRYSLPDAVLFFVSNLSAGAPGLAVRGIPGTLDGLNDPGSWNGPLWTLFWEIVCYVVVGIVLGLLRPQLARIALLVPFLVGSAFVFSLDAGWGPVPTPPDWPLVPILTFLAGSLVYLFQDIIPANPLTGILAGSLVVLVSALGFTTSLVHLPVSLFLLIGSLYLPMYKVGSRFDISYGVYIYGWPVQQFLASLGLNFAVQPLGFAAASLMLVTPIAWMSCRYVEKPAQLWHRSLHMQRKIPELA